VARCRRKGSSISKDHSIPEGACKKRPRGAKRTKAASHRRLGGQKEERGPLSGGTEKKAGKGLRHLQGGLQPLRRWEEKYGRRRAASA